MVGSPSEQALRGLRCGESGIRTHGTFPYTRFPVVHLRPLGHLSIADSVFKPRARTPTRKDTTSGESGIRTRGTLTGTPDFESGTFGRSVISPPPTMTKRTPVVNINDGRAEVATEGTEDTEDFEADQAAARRHSEDADIPHLL